jgi:ABC-2 type transport system permease protein
MFSLKSWRALLVREYREHRIPFFYFPLGIIVLLALSAVSALGFHRVNVLANFPIPSGLKIYEIGYIGLIALWLVYLAIVQFFYFGDAFSADRRNNAMFFWKSMPVSDLKILASKFVAGAAMFPLVIFVMAALTGLMHFVAVNLAALALPGLVPPDPLTALASFGQISLFGIVFMAIGMLWYAPFFAWVGGLSTVFGRWSLPLAFVIPGLIGVIENIAFFGNGPRGGYVWKYLTHRWQFGLSDFDYGQMVLVPGQFSAPTYIGRLFAETDWLSLVIGLIFAAVVVWLASEYRRRRIA